METVITLLVAGVILIVLETVLPGMIAGIVGFVCLAAGVVMSYRLFGPDTGNWVLLGVVVASVLGTIVWLKYFPTSPLGRMFVSESTIGTVGVERPDLLDQTGVAFTPLRPSGTALINGKRVDVVTEGSMIERGTPIRVVGVEGSRVVVRSVPAAA
jgi:membrane-bound serine protease (ClpP class)